MINALDSILPIACILGFILGVGIRIVLTRRQGNRIYSGSHEGRTVQSITLFAILPMAGLVLYFLWKEYGFMQQAFYSYGHVNIQGFVMMIAAAFFVIVLIALIAQSRRMQHVTVFNNISRDIVTLALRLELKKQMASFSVHKGLNTDLYYCAAGIVEVKWGIYRVSYIHMNIEDKDVAEKILTATIENVKDLLAKLGENVVDDGFSLG